MVSQLSRGYAGSAVHIDARFDFEVYHGAIHFPCKKIVYHAMIHSGEGRMIVSYADKRTEAVAGGKAPKGFPSDILRTAQRKLTILENATCLDDLRSPPGNRLEALHNDRKGQHSIRINDQWRICFVWTEAGPESVEVVDYH